MEISINEGIKENGYLKVENYGFNGFKSLENSQSKFKNSNEIDQLNRSEVEVSKNDKCSKQYTKYLKKHRYTMLNDDDDKHDNIDILSISQQKVTKANSTIRSNANEMDYYLTQNEKYIADYMKSFSITNAYHNLTSDYVAINYAQVFKDNEKCENSNIDSKCNDEKLDSNHFKGADNIYHNPYFNLPLYQHYGSYFKNFGLRNTNSNGFYDIKNFNGTPTIEKNDDRDVAKRKKSKKFLSCNGSDPENFNSPKKLANVVNSPHKCKSENGILSKCVDLIESNSINVSLNTDPKAYNLLLHSENRHDSRNNPNQAASMHEKSIEHFENLTSDHDPYDFSVNDIINAGQKVIQLRNKKKFLKSQNLNIANNDKEKKEGIESGESSNSNSLPLGKISVFEPTQIEMKKAFKTKFINTTPEKDIHFYDNGIDKSSNTIQNGHIVKTDLFDNSTFSPELSKDFMNASKTTTASYEDMLIQNGLVSSNNLEQFLLNNDNKRDSETCNFGSAYMPKRTKKLIKTEKCSRVALADKEDYLDRIDSFNNNDNDDSEKVGQDNLICNEFNGIIKDEAYWERRRKNNDAAKKSRDSRRAKEDEIALKAAFLEQENTKLRAQLAVLKNETAKLHYLLFSQYNIVK